MTRTKAPDSDGYPVVFFLIKNWSIVKDNMLNIVGDIIPGKANLEEINYWYFFKIRNGSFKFITLMQIYTIGNSIVSEYQVLSHKEFQL